MHPFIVKDWLQFKCDGFFHGINKTQNYNLPFKQKVPTTRDLLDKKGTYMASYSSLYVIGSTSLVFTFFPFT